MGLRPWQKKSGCWMPGACCIGWQTAIFGSMSIRKQINREVAGAMKKGKWKVRLQFKLLLGLVLMAFVLMLILAPAISGLYRSHMEDYYSQLAFNQASIAAEIIDGDTIKKYYEGGEKDT